MQPSRIPSITVENVVEDNASPYQIHSDRAQNNDYPLESILRRDNKPPGRPRSTGTRGTTFASWPTMSDDGDTIFPRHYTMDSTKTAVNENTDEGKRTKKDKKGKNEKEDQRTAHERELELDLSTDPTPFQFRPYQLAHMLGSKDSATLRLLGGTKGILRGLGTDADTGLSAAALIANSSAAEHYAAAERAKALAERKKKRGTEEAGQDEKQSAFLESEFEGSVALNGTLDDRRRVYGSNILPPRRSKSLLELMWRALKDKILVVLCVAGVVSLALGLFQTFGPREHGEAPVEWVEGAAILIAVLCVVSVGSFNDWQKERQFRALNEKKEERGVKVIRDGTERVVDIKEVVVGDIALLEPGEIVPCDGIFLTGHNVRCDESGATGESDAIKKLSFEECEILGQEGTEDLKHTDPFVISGSKVIEGVGRYVIVAVGTKSYNGGIMMALRTDAENTPLQKNLIALAGIIAKAGLAVGATLFLALLIRFLAQLRKHDPPRTPNQHGIAFAHLLIISVTVVVVAVPEGLPLAVTLTLAFATKCMVSENLLVRVLGSCETMANASVICTDKTGTLTQNSMTVVAGSVGIHAKFVRQLNDNPARTNADGPDGQSHSDDFSTDQAQLHTVIPQALQELFNEAIAVNSTAFADTDPETGKLIFVGSKTETALLQFAKELGWGGFKETREAAEIVCMIPFSSERKAMGVVVKLKGGKGYRIYLKGASEILSRKCITHVAVRASAQAGHSSDGSIQVQEIGALARENIDRTIVCYADQALRTLALCYREFQSWPPAGVQLDDSGQVPFHALAQDLTLIGIVGIEDPLRDGVRSAVANCIRAGVAVKMCTGDNVLTARSIATQCGIFTPGGLIMEGPVFRQLSRAEMIEIAPRLQVLARSSPEDKKILVETLKAIGETVAVTGDGTNDGPALKTAHVGFSMGISGTEVAKEASDIIIMDDNFASIVRAIMWGRSVNDGVRKFLQFVCSTNVSAVIITFVSAVSSAEGEPVLSAVQLLWVNLILDTFAAMGLTTDPATEKSLDRKLDRKSTPLFSTDMYMQILYQSTYQVIIILIFHFLGFKILGLGDHLADERRNGVLQTLIFNTFVFAQVFNSVNCRRLDKRLNVFEGISKNRFFLPLTLIEVGIQVLIVFFGGAAFKATRIGGLEWGISIALGFVTIPLGALVRLLPNGPHEKLFRLIGLFGKQEEVLPIISPEAPGASSLTDAVQEGG